MIVRQKKIKPKKEVLKRSKALGAKKKLGKFIISSVLLVLIVSFLGSLLYWESLSIQTISVQGNDIVESDEIITEIDKTLAEKYWYVFPKDSVFIYPKKVIIAQLLKQFNRLVEVEVSVDSWNSLVIDVKERGSDSIWCEEDREDFFSVPDQKDISLATSTFIGESEDLKEFVSVEPSCYFSDLEGYIFAQAPIFSNNVFIKLSGLLTNQPIGQSFLAKESYEAVIYFVKNLANIFKETGYENYRLIETVIINKNSYEAIVVDTAKEFTYEWKIFFNNEYPAKVLINNIYTVLNSEPFKKEMLKNKGNLDSIDLRYGEKVFYKFK